MLREESIPERPEEITVHESNAAMTNPELSSAHPPSNDTVETVPTISTIRDTSKMAGIAKGRVTQIKVFRSSSLDS
ncbi:unnamed protein product [Enterobius vermicularis]|uniref:KID domain-containing protein n=1 Tax=Enterobius vermicularis TaxID=51028 RepID=A0A0N4V6N4_ENTVE|nr:unnamed protein product [Enterobius vermicularis]